VVLIIGSALAIPAAWAVSPNVVLITIDTVRADHLGCYGYKQAHTPTLDALAREGVLFRTAVAQVPLTLPSHCSIMTGTYPTLHGVRDNLGYTLGDDPPTLATLLKQKGYVTAAFVGAEVLDPRRGLNQGFDTYSCPFRRKPGRNNPLIFNLPDVRRPAEEVVNDALSWMRSQPRGAIKPFFVWIHLYDPHLPYDPPEPFRSLLPSRYDGAIAYADNAVGKFLAYLREQSLYDPALIITASDHGESLGEHGELTHGYFIYDATLLVPLIIKPPANAAIAPRRVDASVRTIDIAPTVLQLLGIPPAPRMQGSSLLSLMLGKTTTSPTGVAYCETFYPSEFGWSPLRAVRTGRYKYIDAPKPELYDLVADPQEIHNLYQTKRAVALELKSQFDSLAARVTPKVPRRQTPVSPADAEMLASLGYFAASSAPTAGRPGQAAANSLPFFPSTYMLPPGAGRPGQRLPDPKDELATYKLLTSSTQLAGQGQCAQAIPLLTRLVQGEHSLFLAQLTLSKCDLSVGKYAAAEAGLNAALRLRPDNLEAKFYMGICQFQEGRFNDALASLQPLAKVLPNEPYLHFYLGGIYENNGAPAQALEEYQKCAAIDPSFEIAVYKAGYFLAKSGKFSEAAVQFKKVVEMDPRNAQAHFNLALAYQKSGNEAAARPEFATACKLDPARCLPPDQR
jgi:arylsulfatase A-like enzyme/thioredoxin-like negative regulator of GroEL